MAKSNAQISIRMALLGDEQIKRRLRELGPEGQRALRDIERATGPANKGLLAVDNTVNRLDRNFRHLVAGVAVGVLAREAQQLADSWTSAGNRIAAVEALVEKPLAGLDDLADMAVEARTEIEPIVDLYARMARAGIPLQRSEEEIRRAVELTTKAFVAGGASVSERRSAILQLSQGLQSGELMGEELRSIRENAPLIAQALADEFDRSVGDLKELGAQGEITADRIFNAILRAAPLIEKQFAATESTIGDAFTNMRTELGRYVHDADEAVGMTEKLAGFINYAADNLDVFTDAAVVAATAIGGRFAGQALMTAIPALANFGSLMVGQQGPIARSTALILTQRRAMDGLKASMAFLGGPWGALILGIGAAIGYMALQSRDLESALGRVDDTMRDLTQINGEIEKDQTRLKDLSEALQEAIKNQGDEAEATARKEIAAVNDRIAKNQELAETYAVLLRAQMAEAEAALRRSERTILGKYRGQTEAGFKDREASSVLGALPPPSGPLFDTPRAALEAMFEQAAAAQDAGAQLTRQQRQAIEDYNTLLQQQAEFEAKRKALEELGNQPEPAETGRGAPGRAGDGDGDASDDSDGPTPEELAAMREMLELQHQLDVARARGDDKAAQAIEDQIALRKMVEELEKAGVDNAEEVAQQRMNAVRAARAEAQAAEDLKASEEERLEILERQAEMEREGLRFSAHLARLRGNETEIRQLERKLFIEERIAELQRLDPGLGAGAARVRAIFDADQIDWAEMTGRWRDAIGDGMKSGVRAAFDGDLDRFLEYRLKDAAAGMFDRAIDHLLDALDMAFRQQQASGSGGIGAFFGNVLGSLFGGNLTGGTGTDSLTGGEDVIMGGHRAEGGPVKAGYFYEINERGREWFMPTVDGQVIPTHGFRGSPGGGGAPQIHIEINDHVGAKVEATPKRGPNNEPGVQLDLKRMLNQTIESGGVDPAMRNRFGVAPKTGARG